MLPAQATGHNDQSRRKSSRRNDAVGKLAASAFMSVARNAGEEGEEKEGKMPDQRRINEIFIRLKTAEMSSLYFAVLGILLGIFDYEISYDDTLNNEKITRII